MSKLDFLNGVLLERGASGREFAVSKFVESEFKKLGLKTNIDKFYNVTGEIGNGEKTVLIVSHLDEIAMMVMKIEDDGFIGFCSVGGIDPRTLLAQEVYIGDEKIYGVIGAKPPHILTEKDKKIAIKMTDLFVDVGMKKEEVLKKIRIGDIITFKAPPINLINNRVVSKSLDDRMGFQIIKDAVELIGKNKLPCKAIFAGSVCEETGAHGASAIAYATKPDYAIVLDVTFGTAKNSPHHKTFDIAKPCILISPYCDRRLYKKISNVAKKENIEITTEVSGSDTGTDADSLQEAVNGIPCVVVQVPIKYMHTTVELIDCNTISSAAKLVAGLLFEMDEVESWL